MSDIMRLAIELLHDRITPGAGDLDPSFGGDGVASIPMAQPSIVTRVSSVPDGRSHTLIRSGTSPFTYTLQRFEADGDPDPAFGTGGMLSIPPSSDRGDFFSITSLADGGAMLFGPILGSSNPVSDFRVVRVTSAGVLDPTFGTGGTVTISEFGTYGTNADPHNAWIPAPVVQPDGNILLLGNRTLYSTVNGFEVGVGDMAVARLTATGQLDPTFGGGGRSYVSFPSGMFSNAGATGAAVQSDGRIIVGGYTATTAVATTSTTLATFASPVAVRLTAGGQLDSTFGSGGRVLPAYPLTPGGGGAGQGGFESVRILSDGRIVLAGYMDLPSGSTGVATRLTSDGSVDASFGTQGLAFSARYGPIPAAIDPAGRPIFSGAFGIIRLTQDGVPDARFGNGGTTDVRTLAGFSVNDGVAGIAVQPNGNILFGGFNSTNVNAYVARLLGNAPPPGFVAAAAGTLTAGGPANGTMQVMTSYGGAYLLPDGSVALPTDSTVRSTTADVTGDGIPDYIVGPGPGTASLITVFDGLTGLVVADFLAFESSFTGGAFVATADLDGDSKAEVVVSPDQGGGPRVVVYSIAIGGFATQRASFFGFDDASFRGGARVALGDVDHDGRPDLAVAAGFLGGPRVALLDGRSLLNGTQVKLVSDFYAFPGTDASTLRNGTFVAIGDLNGDGYGDLIFGGGPGSAPRVFILNGQTVSAGNVPAAQDNPLANFFVNGNSQNRGGVRVAAVNADGDSKEELVVGSGEGSAANVRVYLGKNFTSANEPSVFQDLAVFGGAILPGGVYVG